MGKDLKKKTSVLTSLNNDEHKFCPYFLLYCITRVLLETETNVTCLSRYCAP